MSITNCSNLKRNQQPDGTSCGVYVSELAAHYLFTGHSHCLPVAKPTELREHALQTLRDLDEAYSSASALRFTPLAKWLQVLRSSYDTHSLTDLSRDSGVSVDIDHAVRSFPAITSNQYSLTDETPVSPCSVIILQKSINFQIGSPPSLGHSETSPSTPVYVDLLTRISRQIASRRQKIVMQNQSLSSKMNEPAPRYNYSHNTRLAEWKRNRDNIITSTGERIAANMKLVSDLITTRVILGAFWYYFANRTDDGRFQQLKFSDSRTPIQEVARFWTNQTDEVFSVITLSKKTDTVSRLRRRSIPCSCFRLERCLTDTLSKWMNGWKHSTPSKP